MQAKNSDELVRDYLSRLQQSAGQLPEGRRSELIDEVREHIESARAHGEDSKTAVRNLLDRLGTPDEIVAAELGDPASAQAATRIGDPQAGWVFAPPPQSRQPDNTRLRAQDVAALILLPVGGFLFFVGWIVGAVLLWLSDRWSTTQKLVATLVWPFGLVTPLFATAASSLVAIRTCSGYVASDGSEQVICDSGAVPPWLAITLTLLVWAAPIAVIIWLARTARPGGASAAADQSRESTTA